MTPGSTGWEVGNDTGRGKEPRQGSLMITVGSQGSALLALLALLALFFVFLFLAALGLCCCARAFSSCGERGLLFLVVRRLLIAVASPVVEHGL